MRVRELIELLRECDPDAKVVLADLGWPAGHPYNRDGGPTFEVDQCEEVGGGDEEHQVAVWSGSLKLFVMSDGGL